MEYPTEMPKRVRLHGHQVSVSLDDESRRTANRVGCGNMSGGIRKALKLAAVRPGVLADPMAQYGSKKKTCRAYAVNLDAVSHTLAALIGQGNVSAGVRLALRVAAKP